VDLRCCGRCIVILPEGRRRGSEDQPFHLMQSKTDRGCVVPVESIATDITIKQPNNQSNRTYCALDLLGLQQSAFIGCSHKLEAVRTHSTCDRKHANISNAQMFIHQNRTSNIHMQRCNLINGKSLGLPLRVLCRSPTSSVILSGMHCFHTFPETINYSILLGCGTLRS
jgi:hypothetical protein